MCPLNDHSPPRFGEPAVRVSVVVPTLNAQEHLVEALDSIAAQNVELEVIAVDGGSTDRTLDILASYDFVETVVAPGESQTAAVNCGFGRATGDILCWLNADDVLTPGSLEFVTSFFGRNPDEDFLYGDSLAIDGAGRAFGLRCNVRDGQFDELLDADFIVQPSAFWTRRIWESAGPLREDFHYVFDYDFFLRAAASTELNYEPIVFSLERVHAAAKTSQGGSARAEEFIRMIRQHGRNEIPLAFRPEVAATHLTNGLKNVKSRDWEKARLLFGEAFRTGRPRMRTMAHFIVGLLGGSVGVSYARLVANWGRSTVIRRRKPVFPQAIRSVVD